MNLNIFDIPIHNVCVILFILIFMWSAYCFCWKNIVICSSLHKTLYYMYFWNNKMYRSIFCRVLIKWSYPQQENIFTCPGISASLASSLPVGQRRDRFVKSLPDGGRDVLECPVVLALPDGGSGAGFDWLRWLRRGNFQHASAGRTGAETWCEERGLGQPAFICCSHRQVLMNLWIGIMAPNWFSGWVLGAIVFSFSCVHGWLVWFSFFWSVRMVWSWYHEKNSHSDGCFCSYVQFRLRLAWAHSWKSASQNWAKNRWFGWWIQWRIQ